MHKGNSFVHFIFNRYLHNIDINIYVYKNIIGGVKKFVDCKNALVINMFNFINNFCLEISKYIEKEKIYNSLLIPENKNWRVD